MASIPQAPVESKPTIPQSHPLPKNHPLAKKAQSNAAPKVGVPQFPLQNSRSFLTSPTNPQLNSTSPKTTYTVPITSPNLKASNPLIGNNVETSKITGMHLIPDGAQQTQGYKPLNLQQKENVQGTIASSPGEQTYNNGFLKG